MAALRDATPPPHADAPHAQRVAVASARVWIGEEACRLVQANVAKKVPASATRKRHPAFRPRGAPQGAPALGG